MRRWRCCGRGWWRWRSSRTAAPGGAAAVPNVRFPFLPMFRSSLFLPFPLFSQSVFLSSVFFYVFLSSRFLFSFGSSSLSPLFFLFFSFFLPSLLSFFPPLLSSLPSAFLGSIYRGQGRCFFLTALMGSSRLVGHWARLPRFGGWCAVGGRPLCPVGGLQARVAGKNSKKSNPFSLLPRCVIGGRR